MSTIKRTLAAAVLAGAIVPALFIALSMFPAPPLERVAVAVAYPVAYVLAEAAPGFMRQLSSGGGPDPHTWAITISIVDTWLAFVFAVCFLGLWRMRSNSTPHADARGATTQTQSPAGARAGERER